MNHRLLLICTRISLFIILTLLCSYLIQKPVNSSSGMVVNRIFEGSGSYVFIDKRGNPSRPITIWYYNPSNLPPDSPILFVMHGVKRNGREYRDQWIQYADKYKFLLIVPEFSQNYYFGSENYNLGNMFPVDWIKLTGKRNLKAKPNDVSKWTFTAVEHIFQDVKRITGKTSKTYDIYGHSAGGQFVHRMAMFLPDTHVERAVAANAGWYTFPSFDIDFPYGLSGSGIDQDQLKKAFSRNLILLLGEKDTDKNDKYLRKSKEALDQGEYRLERGKNFFSQAEKIASETRWQFGWEIVTVPDAGHSNIQMAQAAAYLLYGEGNSNVVLEEN